MQHQASSEGSLFPFLSPLLLSGSIESLKSSLPLVSSYSHGTQCLRSLLLQNTKGLELDRCGSECWVWGEPTQKLSLLPPCAHYFCLPTGPRGSELNGREGGVWPGEEGIQQGSIQGWRPHKQPLTSSVTFQVVSLLWASCLSI